MKRMERSNWLNKISLTLSSVSLFHRVSLDIHSCQHEFHVYVHHGLVFAHVSMCEFECVCVFVTDRWYRNSIIFRSLRISRRKTKWHKTAWKTLSLSIPLYSLMKKKKKTTDEREHRIFHACEMCTYDLNASISNVLKIKIIPYFLSISLLFWLENCLNMKIHTRTY